MDQQSTSTHLFTFLADGTSTHIVSRSTALISMARISLAQKLLAPTMDNIDLQFFTMLTLNFVSEINRTFIVFETVCQSNLQRAAITTWFFVFQKLFSAKYFSGQSYLRARIPSWVSPLWDGLSHVGRNLLKRRNLNCEEIKSKRVLTRFRRKTGMRWNINILKIMSTYPRDRFRFMFARYSSALKSTTKCRSADSG